MSQYLRIIIWSILLISSGSVFAQEYHFLNNEYLLPVENSVIYNINAHQSIKPYVNDDFDFDCAKSVSPVTDKHFIGIINTGFSKDLSNKTFKNNNALGVYVRGNLGKKAGFYLLLQDNYSNLSDLTANKIDSNEVIPQYSRYFKKNGDYYHFPLFTGRFYYKPFNFLRLSTGCDKHFIGLGYRSLFLSDFASPYPFISLDITKSRLKYMLLVGWIPDWDTYVNKSDLNEKYMAVHYLSLNITDRINLGFYESAVWRGRDTSIRRGFEYNYLNPFVFLWSTQYSLNSPDNASLGVSLNLRFFKKTFLYSQLYVDDFIGKQFLDNKGWWGNKTAVQLGLKSFNAFDIHKLFLQAEFNTAKPYTYSHASTLNNFGYMYQPLAHPLGANFYEYLGIARYYYKRYSFSCKLFLQQWGADTDLKSYGSDIYKPYSMRVADYGITMLQGKKMSLFSQEIKASYCIYPKWDLQLEGGIQNIKMTGSKNSLSVFIGLTNRIYNLNGMF